MTNYIFAYHGGSMPESEADRAAVMAKWGAWMQGLGEAITYAGAPLGKSSTVSATGVSDDGGSNPLSGFTVVQADSLDSALEMAKGCPINENGGSVEVAEMMSM